MNNTICYLNTDLDLVGPDDLTELGKTLEAAGASPLHVTRGNDGQWYATIETNAPHTEPEPKIAQLLAIIETSPEPPRSLWTNCTRRELNIGYALGAHPWGFNQGLSTELLGRLANVGASLRITLYPDRDEATRIS